MTPQERLQRAEIIGRLAVATREKLERQTLDVYIEALQGWSVETLRSACMRLQTSATWFPKVAEINDTCNVVRQHEVERKQARQLSSGTPADPERLSQFLADVKAEVARKSMK